MAKVFATGDSHGYFHWDKLFALNNAHPELTKEDMVIVLGDFGVPWHFPPNHQDEVSFHKLKRLRFSIGVIDGNHENFDYFGSLPIESAFDGEVAKIAEDIYWLKRGQVYSINGLKLFTFGGANSIDKHMRIEGLSWWPEEIPTLRELGFGLDSLKEKAKNKVDYILTHEAPLEALYELYDDDPYHPTKVQSYCVPQFFDVVAKNTEFKHWYFGHHHMDRKVNEKYSCLYHSVVELTKEG